MMSRYDRDIDGTLNQKRGDTSPKVGDWEPSRASCGIRARLFSIVITLLLWEGILGILGWAR